MNDLDESAHDAAHRRSHRDLDAFEKRAADYETGWLGRLHHDIAERVIDLVLSWPTHPRRILDVGCGTGYLLRSLAERLPDAELLDGIDPAAAMIRTAQTAASDPRLAFTVGSAEQLPYEHGNFDLLIGATSFDHWHDQAAGLAQCARVLAPGGTLLLTDLFSVWLTPTLAGARQHKARTKKRATKLLTEAGFTESAWHGDHLLFLNTLTATRA